MKILLPDYGLAYDTLVALIPPYVFGLYEIDQNKKLNLFRLCSKNSRGAINVSVPLDKVHLITRNEVTMEIVSDSYYLTIFLKVDYILIQLF